MRATRSGIAFALSLSLLVPGSVAAQEATFGLEVPDPMGDLIDLATEQPGDGPSYADLTGISLEADDMFLWVTFTTATDIPVDLDPMSTTMGYILNVDADADGEADKWVTIDSIDGWSGSIVDASTGETKHTGVPVVADNTVVVNVPWPYLGDRESLRYQGLMQGQHFPDPANDPLTWTDWEDRVPNDEDAWLALGEDLQVALAPLRGIDALLKKKNQPKANYDEVRKEARQYLSRHPEAVATVAAEFGREPATVTADFDDLLRACAKDMKKRRPAAGATSSGNCVNGFVYLMFIYAADRDDDAYELLKRYLGATTSRQANPSAYLMTIGIYAAELPKLYPDLFSD